MWDGDIRRAEEHGAQRENDQSVMPPSRPPSALRTLGAVLDTANRVSCDPAAMLDGREADRDGTRLDDRCPRARTQPREGEYAIHDTALPGFMLRVCDRKG